VIHHNEIFAAVTRVPFKRFTLRTRGGRSYEVDDPGLVTVGTKAVRLLDRPSTFVTLETSAIESLETPRECSEVAADAAGSPTG
jgi:hypothetical protein